MGSNKKINRGLTDGIKCYTEDRRWIRLVRIRVRVIIVIADDDLK